MGVFDTYYAFKFVYLLSQPWTETDAFKQGIISENGEQLKKMSQLVTSEEKAAYTRFHKLVYNLKRLIEKVPLVGTTIGRYATALKLIKEELNIGCIDEAFKEYLIKEGIEIPVVTQVILESKEKDYHFFLNTYFEETDTGELVVANEMCTTAGVDMGGAPKKKLELPEETFAGDIVFTCDPNTFQNCVNGKKKYVKYKTYVGEDELGETIRQYGREYPDKGIIIKHSLTNAMVYLRRRKK